ncbi:MAG: efflux RND transporter periplasmic adaptor subunit [Chloroflexi bacterium]|nr:efflux RND transporter periplasmic adaptor subunit [Chloroflexota bacterium]
MKEASLGTTLSYSGDVKPKSQAAVTAKMVGRIEQINVDVGSEVKAGDVIAVLEHSTIDAQVNQAETALLVAKARLAQMEAGPRQETVAQAEANLDSMKQKLASGNAGPRTEAVAQAEANLRQAEAKLAQLQAGPTPEQIEVAKTNIRLAKNQLYSIQTQADAYRVAAGRGAPPFTEGMKEAQSGVGYEQVQLAEAQLAALMAKAQPEVIAQAQAGVEAARQQLNLVKNPLTEWDLAQLQDAVQVAEEQVKLARSPYTAQDLEVARAQVKQAQAAIDLANTQVADSVVTAPFDGVVSDRFLTAGSLAAPASPIVNLISSDLEISLSVEEARSGMLKVGQPATVQVGAYPGQNFEGTISSIAPTVDPKTRTLVAKISVKDDQKQLKAGMYARVNIAAGQKQTGLLVPKDSVVKRGERDVVFTVVDGKAKMLEVQVGPTDGTNVQLLKGINAGEMIIQSPGSALQDGDVVAQ